MPKASSSKPLKILVTNDDGIDASGLKVLEKIAKKLSSDVWVVAPEVEQSGAGHSLTINSPIRFRKISAKRYAIGGTPTDCVLSAVRMIVPGKIDLVLSGVNRGGNIGEDITHSGTVAGALEGTLFDIPSIAFSLKIDFGSGEMPKIHWKTAETHAPALIKKLLAQKWQRDTMFNVNFPDCEAVKVKGVKMVAHGKRSIPKELTKDIDPKGRPLYWMGWAGEGFDIRRPDSDIKWLAENYITVTPISVDLTNYSVLDRLKKTIEK